MVRRSTWLALLVLAGLIAFTVYLRQKPAPAEEGEATPAAESQSVFDPGEGLANHIKIASATGETVELELGSDGAWVLIQPFEAEADQGQAEAAATQIGGLRNMRELELTPEAAGLVEPPFTITAGFTGGKSHSLEIGDQTPSESGYYARLDDGKVLIVSGDGIDSLLGLLTSPPYLETPTPSPVPATETTVPAAGTAAPTEAAATPAP